MNPTFPLAAQIASFTGSRPRAIATSREATPVARDRLDLDRSALGLARENAIPMANVMR